jgi:FKBP-type peptidyl-prolyl cis-trans isomerase FkpA
MKVIYYLSLIFLALSCKTYNDTDKTTFDKKIQNYLKHKKLNFTKSESGLYYKIEKAGEGDFIQFTDEVSFIYQGRLLDGTIFDNKNVSKPITFKVSSLIEGWKEVMMYMKKGSKAKLIVPPYLGYGDYELDAIPKHSILIFEMEIIDVY